MTSRRLPLLIAGLLLAQGAFAQTGGIDLSKPVATVNGEEISAVDYFKRLEWFRPDKNSAYLGQPAGFQVLRQMISDKIIYQMAKAKGVAPTNPEIDARLAELYATNPELKDQLAAAGRTEAEVRGDLANQEAQFKLLTYNIVITDQEVEAHYKQYPSEFRLPKKVKLRVIVVTDDATQKKVDDALKAGTAFNEVAKQFSLDASKNIGGEYGDVPVSALADATRTAVEATATGKTTTWITGEGREARVKFLVEGVTPETLTPLDAKLKRSLRRRLMLDRSRAKQTLAKDLDAATIAAKVVINQPGFQSLFNQLVEQLKSSRG